MAEISTIACHLLFGTLAGYQSYYLWSPSRTHEVVWYMQQLPAIARLLTFKPHLQLFQCADERRMAPWSGSSLLIFHAIVHGNDSARSSSGRCIKLQRPLPLTLPRSKVRTLRLLAQTAVKKLSSWLFVSLEPKRSIRPKIRALHNFTAAT